MLSDDYCLILGMPGTGKTYLITILLKILCERNLKILVTSYTNTALDNIILKFIQGFPELENRVLRFGSNF